MATKRTEVLDDAGNIIAPPEPGSPIAQIVWLLEYARKRDFHIPKVQIGDTVVHVTDLKQTQAGGQERITQDLDPESDMGKILIPSGG